MRLANTSARGNLFYCPCTTQWILLKKNLNEICFHFIDERLQRRIFNRSFNCNLFKIFGIFTELIKSPTKHMAIVFFCRFILLKLICSCDGCKTISLEFNYRIIFNKINIIKRSRKSVQKLTCPQSGDRHLANLMSIQNKFAWTWYCYKYKKKIILL